jgi:hypothetical protein
MFWQANYIQIAKYSNQSVNHFIFSTNLQNSSINQAIKHIVQGKYGFLVYTAHDLLE